MQTSAKKARGTVMHRLLLAWKSHQNEGLCNWWGHKFMPVHIIVKTCQTWAFQSWFRWEKQPNYKVSQSHKAAESPNMADGPPLLWRTKYIIVAVCWWISVQLDEFPHWIFFWCWHISRSPRCFFRCKRFTHSNPTCLLVRVEEFLLETSSISPSRSIDLAAPAWYLRPTWIRHQSTVAGIFRTSKWEPQWDQPRGTATKLGHNGGLLIKTYVDC